MLLYAFGFVAALLLSFVLTWLVRRIATRHGWTFAPVSQRHIHARPVPRLGGIAIFISLILTVAGVLTLAELFSVTLLIHVRVLLALLGPAIVIFLLGLLDDFVGVKAYVKFAVQAGCGLMLYAGGLRVAGLPALSGQMHFGHMLSAVATVAWVLLITNAFNLLDGLDGLAAGSALFSTLVVTTIALLGRNDLIAVLGLALAGAILGFLRFNFNPATIFLGDCGSLTIGFVLAAMALAGSQKSPTIIAVAIPLLSFGLPILDTALAVLRRFLSGRPIFTADDEHIHHKLLRRGLSQRQAVLLLYGVSAGFGLVTLLLVGSSGAPLGVALLALGAALWVGIQHLGYHEVGELQRVAMRSLHQKQAIVHNLALRRAIESLGSANSFADVCNLVVSGLSGAFEAFELSLPAGPDGSDAPLFYAWRSDGPASENGDAVFTVTLHLRDSGSLPLGELSIHRRASDKPVYVDMDLMTADLQSALSAALERLAKDRRSATAASVVA